MPGFLVAPRVTVIPVKVLDSRGSNAYSGVNPGVDFAGAKGKSGDLANLNLGGSVSQVLHDTVFSCFNQRN